MKQAIVIIHGIGEQVPMGTVRGFVEAVLPKKGDKSTYFSKPDLLSETFELRRLQATSSPTHFFEYYWQHHVDDIDGKDVLHWMGRLIFRKKKNVPKGLITLWLLTWITILLLIFLISSGAVSYFFSLSEGIKKFSFAGVAMFILSGIVNLVLVRYIGDAARYLSPQPANIKSRQKIRSEGIKLLRSLHNSGTYDRIIVVGHSLGSVIGYDIITHLWQEMNTELPSLHGDREVKAYVRDKMQNGKKPQIYVQYKLPRASESLLNSSGKDSGELDNFRHLQLHAWKEQRYFGNPWLISDFITLGSPLAHAMFLLAEDGDELEDRKKQRELPTCPPVYDTKENIFTYLDPQSVDVGYASATKRTIFTPHILHHAAPFAVTRWTNLYFPVKYGVFGDLVGGPLRDVFGKGILDLPVTTNRWGGFAGCTPVSHTSYWLQDDCRLIDEGNRSVSISALRQALDVEGLKKNYRVVAPVDMP